MSGPTHDERRALPLSLPAEEQSQSSYSPPSATHPTSSYPCASLTMQRYLETPLCDEMWCPLRVHVSFDEGSAQTGENTVEFNREGLGGRLEVVEEWVKMMENPTEEMEVKESGDWLEMRESKRTTRMLKERVLMMSEKALGKGKKMFTNGEEAFGKGVKASSKGRKASPMKKRRRLEKKN